jgi:ribosomal protein L19E
MKSARQSTSPFIRLLRKINVALWKMQKHKAIQEARFNKTYSNWKTMKWNAEAQKAA